MKPRLAGMIVAVVLMAGSAEAAYDPKATLFNEKVLQGALMDVAKMPEAELRAFTRYLAECEKDSSDVGEHACAVAYGLYRIEFGAEGTGGRPLDDLLNARADEESVGDMDVRMGRRTPADVVDVKTMAREVGILAKLEAAARARFRALRAGGK